MTDGWAKPAESAGAGPYIAVGSLDASNESVSPERIGKTANPKGGGTTAAQPVAAKTAVHEVVTGAENSTNASIPTADEIALAKAEGCSPLHIQATEKVSRHFLVATWLFRKPDCYCYRR